MRGIADVAVEKGKVEGMRPAKQANAQIGRLLYRQAIWLGPLELELSQGGGRHEADEAALDGLFTAIRTDGFPFVALGLIKKS